MIAMPSTAAPPESQGKADESPSGENPEPFTLIDLFCGCGGYSYGFQFPDDEYGPWRILRGFDVNSNAVRTFNSNIGREIARVADLEKEDPWGHLRELNLDPGQLTCLHASPPCEAYSANNRKNGHGRDFRFRIALNWVSAFRPKIVTIENVLRLREWDTVIQKRLSAMGYEVKCFVVNSADYGVPQRRKRLFYVAYDKSLSLVPSAPAPTHASPGRLRKGQVPWITVREAIRDLPSRIAGHGPDQFISRLDTCSTEVCARIGDYAALLRPTRGSKISNHQARSLNELMQQRVKALKPGQAIAHLPKELQPKMGFRGAYGRLDPDQPAKTITTGVRGPSHGPFLHYAQDRLITIREAARLQSFPDDFALHGGLDSQAYQVGNAVPPLLAAAFRRLFSKVLRTASTSLPASNG